MNRYYSKHQRIRILLLSSALLLLGFFLLAEGKSTPVYASTDHCGHIAADETWSAGENVHVVSCNVTVDTGVTLTIEAGAIVKFESNKLLGVHGSLKVLGTDGNMVEITSLKDDTVGGDTNGDGNATAPAAGDWGHIAFFDDSVDEENLIEYARIRYGGNFYTTANRNYYYCYKCTYRDVVRFDSASPTIRHNTITENEFWALGASIDSFPTVHDNTLTGNGANGLRIRGGTLSAPSPTVKHWSNTDVVYGITGNSTIDSGVTLVIDPNVMVKFADNTLMGVHGVLKIQGTDGNMVEITSLKDDTVGGDTNGDGNATAPAAGDWGHIAFFDDSVDEENLIEYARIRYGGNFYTTANRDYYDCYKCTYWGAVRFDSASPTIRYTSVLDNDAGILVTEAGPTLVCNDIQGNAQFGLRNKTTNQLILAESLWWGSTSGPTHPSNPGGSGDKVSDGVDFTPWARTPCVTPMEQLSTNLFLPMIRR